MKEITFILVSRSSEKEFNEKFAKALIEINGHEIRDIKFSTTSYNNDDDIYVEYSALIIYDVFSG